MWVVAVRLTTGWTGCYVYEEHVLSRTRMIVQCLLVPLDGAFSITGGQFNNLPGLPTIGRTVSARLRPG